MVSFSIMLNEALPPQQNPLSFKEKIYKERQAGQDFFFLEEREAREIYRGFSRW